MAGLIQVQHNDKPALYLSPVDGRYTYRFKPESPTDTLTLYNNSTGDIKRDNILTHLMLKHGKEPGEYVPNESEASRVQQVWQNFQELQRSMEDRERGLQVLIRETASGILEKFVDSQGNLLTDRATIAGQILERVKSDTSESIRKQLPGLISDEVIGESARSIISQSGDNILLGLKNKMGELMAQMNLTPNGVYLKGSKIYLDGDTHIENAFARKLLTERVDAQTVKAFVGEFNRVIVNELVADTVNAGTIRTRVLSANSLQAYRGFIGGFRLGDHPKGDGNWITGDNQFSIGMSDGRGGRKRTAFWVNWGQDWNNPGIEAWWITHDGMMHAKNTATFYRPIVIEGQKLDATGVKRAMDGVISKSLQGYNVVREIGWRNTGKNGGSQVGFKTGENSWVWIDITEVG